MHTRHLLFAYESLDGPFSVIRTQLPIRVRCVYAPDASPGHTGSGWTDCNPVSNVKYRISYLKRQLTHSPAPTPSSFNNKMTVKENTGSRWHAAIETKWNIAKRTTATTKKKWTKQMRTRNNVNLFLNALRTYLSWCLTNYFDLLSQYLGVFIGVHVLRT